MVKRFNVTGMSCSACSASVEKAIKKLDGIRSVNVNLLSKNMTVDFDETRIDTQKIIKSVEDTGYGAFLEDDKEDRPLEIERKELGNQFIVSLIFLIPLMYISMGHMLHLPLPARMQGISNAVVFTLVQLLLTLPIVYINRKYYQVGVKTLFHGSPNMDSLIALGSGAALIYGIFAIFRIGYGLGQNEPEMVNHYLSDLYFESAAMILTLITLGKYLEVRSKAKTTDAITKLMDLAPKTALVFRNGKEYEISVDKVVIGDIVLIKPGQSIPVDGIIIEGSSSVDQSALTGESIPVEKQVGDTVMTATINKSGYFKIRAEKVGKDTTIAQVITLVKEAGSSKAPISKLADRVSSIFVPVVICIAVAAVIIWLVLGKSFEFSLSIGITVLVISCPCALGLATPVAIMVGTGKGASNGILIRSAEALEEAKSIDTVVLDKTGTITQGKPEVTDILTADGIESRHLLTIVASIEKPSEHPLADAIIEKAKKENVDCKKVDKFQSVPGKGIVGIIDGQYYFAGNLLFMEENNISTARWMRRAEVLAHEGKTPLYVADREKILGIIAVTDIIKPTSYKAVKQFKTMGLDIVMLTGDNRRTAEAFCRELGIERVVADVLPQDKEKEIRRIQEEGKKVAMIGDGINDAPALVRADVGIAIGSGTDIAIESADIVLMKSDLMDAVTSIRLSKATIRNIKQNLFWAFLYNTLGIPLAAGLFYPLFGLRLNPMFAAAAMSLSSIFVVTNALRLRFFNNHV